MGTRPTRHLLIAAGILASLVFWADEALAAQDGQTFHDWTVKCKSQETGQKDRCALIQTLRRKNANGNQPIMTVLVAPFGSESRLGMLITVPLGVFLPAGLTLTVDDKKLTKQLAYQFCNRLGCRAAVLFDDRLLGLFRTGAKASIAIQDRHRKDIVMAISLNGFSKGVDGIRSH